MKLNLSFGVRDVDYITNADVVDFYECLSDIQKKCFFNDICEVNAKMALEIAECIRPYLLATHKMELAKVFIEDLKANKPKLFKSLLKYVNELEKEGVK